jgi:hypothetical protein
MEPTGIFRAEVVEATASSLKVRVPRLGTNGIYSNVPYYGVKPAVGETIIVGLLEGNSGNPVAITPSPYGETAGGGGSSVGGSDTQVQYNNSGVLSGSANMTFDGTSLNVAGLKLASTAITSTAAELNILDGVTSTTAELNILDGVTSTAAELNILDGVTSTTAELNILDGVTSTAAELNLLDGITAGTVSASLAVIVDSDKDITGFRNVTLTGDLNVDSNLLFVDASADKIGVGTGSPVAGVDIATTGGDTWTTSSWDQGLILNAGSAVRWRTSGSVDWGIGNSGALLYFTSSTAADDSAAADYRMVIEGDTGSVGIGTTSPVGNLTVKSQNREISIIDSGSTNYAEIRAHAAGNATSYAHVNYNAYSHTFLTGGTSRMNIANGGTAHIGTSSRKLIFQPESNEILKLVGDTASARPYISFWNRDASGNLDRKGYIGYPHAANNTSSLYLRCDQGTLDLGAKILLPSTANYVLWPATLNTVTSYSTLRRGTYSGTANVVGYDGSSIRYKENVTNFVKSDWEKIYNLQAVRFTWKEEVAADKHASWGLISEDVYAEIPELGVMRVVEGVNDGNPVPDTVNYEQMCVFLLEAVKDLNARLAAVE